MQQNPTNMSRKTLLVTRRAWSLLRLALMWARRGGIFRNKLDMSLFISSLFQKVMRKLVPANESRGGLVYGDHEFSFGDTPIVHVKMHRPNSSLRFKMPHIPCIKPQVDFDDDDAMWCHGCDDVESTCVSDGEEIDVKAEEFIAKFYAQMKLQRQITLVEYNEQ